MDVLVELVLNLELFNTIRLQGVAQWYIDEDMIEEVEDDYGFPTYFGKRWNKTGETCSVNYDEIRTYKCGILTANRFWFIQDGLKYECRGGGAYMTHKELRVSIDLYDSYIMDYDVENPDRRSPDKDYDFSKVLSYRVSWNDDVSIYGPVKYKGIYYAVDYKDGKFIWEECDEDSGRIYDADAGLECDVIIKEPERNINSDRVWNYSHHIPSPSSLYELIVEHKIPILEDPF